MIMSLSSRRARSTADFFQAFSGNVHQATTTASLGAVGVAGAVEGVEIARAGASASSFTLGGFPFNHPFLAPAVSLGMGICRAFDGASDLAASFLYESEYLLGEEFKHKDHRIPLKWLGGAGRARLSGLYKEVTAASLIYFGVTGIEAAAAGSFSSAFSLGCMGLATAAAADFAVKLALLFEKKGRTNAELATEVASVVFQGLQAAGWYLLPTNPLLGACFLGAAFLYRLCWEGSLARDTFNDGASLVKASGLFQRAPEQKLTLPITTRELFDQNKSKNTDQYRGLATLIKEQDNTSYSFCGENGEQETELSNAMPRTGMTASNATISSVKNAALFQEIRRAPGGSQVRVEEVEPPLVVRKAEERYVPRTLK